MEHKGIKCSVDGCNNPVYSKGLCSMHYARLRRTGTTERKVINQGKCKVISCKEPAICLGFCNKHYHLFKRGKLKEEVDNDANP